ncbi:transposase [Sulfodiicoccus acidiphilus]|uniref:transposase n=1 Tax=Sulfodiicoccus acidiphilus TaxID=1670455 RepID=UPI000F822A58|nr:transposase [Sulfodiicoccus acidiphilus]
MREDLTDGTFTCSWCGWVVYRDYNTSLDLRGSGVGGPQSCGALYPLGKVRL